MAKQINIGGKKVASKTKKVKWTKKNSNTTTTEKTSWWERIDVQIALSAVLPLVIWIVHDLLRYGSLYGSLYLLLMELAFFVGLPLAILNIGMALASFPEPEGTLFLRKIRRLEDLTDEELDKDADPDVRRFLWVVPYIYCPRDREVLREASGYDGGDSDGIEGLGLSRVMFHWLKLPPWMLRQGTRVYHWPWIAEVRYFVDRSIPELPERTVEVSTTKENIKVCVQPGVHLKLAGNSEQMLHALKKLVYGTEGGVLPMIDTAINISVTEVFSGMTPTQVRKAVGTTRVNDSATQAFYQNVKTFVPEGLGVDGVIKTRNIREDSGVEAKEATALERERTKLEIERRKAELEGQARVAAAGTGALMNFIEQAGRAFRGAGNEGNGSAGNGDSGSGKTGSGSPKKP